MFPSLDHLCIEDYKNVYEPAEDTFLLCDAIENEYNSNNNNITDSLIAVEVGSGSGCVITHVAKLFQSNTKYIHCIATDVNPTALNVTNRTSLANHVAVNCIQTNLVDSIYEKLCNKVDILIFNPPYVPTPDEEVSSGGIEAAWAGGTDGRIVIDRFVPYVHDILSPDGQCYLVLVNENKPKQLSRTFQSLGLDTQIILRKQAANEGLQIMRIKKAMRS